MNYRIRVGDVKLFVKEVTEADYAQFEGLVVHPVCSTFALAQAVEWASRLFALDEKEADEEGKGNYLFIKHEHPAFLGDYINIVTELIQVNHHELICSFIARVGDRTIARGETGQKILKKEKLDKLLNPKRS